MIGTITPEQAEAVAEFKKDVVWIDEAGSVPPESFVEADKGAAVPPVSKRLPRRFRRIRDKVFRENWNAGRLSRRPFAGPRKTLAKVNDALAAEGRTLHPTKGFRKASVKAGVASLITQEMKHGRSWPMDRMKQAIIRAGER